MRFNFEIASSFLDYLLIALIIIKLYEFFAPMEVNSLNGKTTIKIKHPLPLNSTLYLNSVLFKNIFWIFILLLTIVIDLYLVKYVANNPELTNNPIIVEAIANGNITKDVLLKTFPLLVVVLLNMPLTLALIYYFIRLHLNNKHNIPIKFSTSLLFCWLFCEVLIGYILLFFYH